MAGFQKGPPTIPGVRHHNEDYVVPFAKSVKAGDGTTRVLFYQNTLINFPQSRLNLTVPEELLLHDRRGRLVYLGGCGCHHACPNHTIYDHSKPEMRRMWVNNIVEVVRANPGLVDGTMPQ